jgi:hypothetical protein
MVWQDANGDGLEWERLPYRAVDCAQAINLTDKKIAAAIG